MLSNDAILKTDPLRLFLLQQASEKIIKAWFLKNLELLELLSLDVEKWIKINNEIVNNLSEIRDEEKEKLLIINNFQKSIFSGYKDTIKDAVGKINEKNFDGILMKLNHDPVKSYFLKLLKA